MEYSFCFNTREDAMNFYDRAYDIATDYGTVRLSDLRDLKGTSSDYLDNKIIWRRDSFLSGVRYELHGDVWCVVFSEPDQYPASDKVTYKHCECRTTWRNTGKSKKTPTPEPFNITVNMDPSKDPNTTIREVIQQANEIKDRPVFITIN